jgi:hypothetical protein
VGVILFRNFPTINEWDFDAFIAAFDLPNYSYEDSLSNAHRIVKTPRVFTANEAPRNFTIYLHHELAQTPTYPRHLFFFCQKAADEGGATPVARSDIIAQRLEKEEPVFYKQLLEKGLKYSHVMANGAQDASTGMG